ncbi:hypothetical protein PspLS_03519 [Pyricularia sp. CBS 133598]|nr:hypothetical protein PspLS_03519 [Pyricularia sp. CBS 133598]
MKALRADGRAKAQGQDADSTAEEYPYAGSTEGGFEHNGVPVSIRMTPQSEQSSQGGKLQPIAKSSTNDEWETRVTNIDDLYSRHRIDWCHQFTKCVNDGKQLTPTQDQNGVWTFPLSKPRSITPRNLGSTQLTGPTSNAGQSSSGGNGMELVTDDRTIRHLNRERAQPNAQGNLEVKIGDTCYVKLAGETEWKQNARRDLLQEVSAGDSQPQTSLARRSPQRGGAKGTSSAAVNVNPTTRGTKTGKGSKVLPNKSGKGVGGGKGSKNGRWYKASFCSIPKAVQTSKTGKTNGKATGKAVGKNTGKATGKVTRKTTKRPTGKVTGKTTRKATRRPTKKPTGKANGKTRANTIARPTKNTTAKTTKKARVNITGKPTKKPTKKATKKTNRNITGKPIKKNTRKSTGRLNKING